jgi:hypothetical protein
MASESKRENSLEFGSYQGCSGYDDCGIVVVYSVVNLRLRESGEIQLYLVVKCNKSDCQSNTPSTVT